MMSNLLEELDLIALKLTINKSPLREKTSIATRNELVDTLFVHYHDARESKNTPAMRYAEGIAIEHSHRRVETGPYGVSIATALAFYSMAFSTSYLRSRGGSSIDIKKGMNKFRESYGRLCAELISLETDEPTVAALTHVRNLKWPGLT